MEYLPVTQLIDGRRVLFARRHKSACVRTSEQHGRYSVRTGMVGVSFMPCCFRAVFGSSERQVAMFAVLFLLFSLRIYDTVPSQKYDRFDSIAEKIGQRHTFWMSAETLKRTISSVCDNWCYWYCGSGMRWTFLLVIWLFFLLFFFFTVSFTKQGAKFMRISGEDNG